MTDAGSAEPGWLALTAEGVGAGVGPLFTGMRFRRL